MKFISGVGVLSLALATFAAPASARDSFVQDGAGLFSPATVSSLNQTIGDFNRQTGKEVVVVSQPSLGGATVQDAAEKVFAQQQVNGVLIFLSKAEKKQGIITDRAARTYFPPGETATIRDAMRGYFRTGDFDTGITTGVNLILAQYRSHERALGGAATRQSYAPTRSTSSLGGGMSLFWLILILIAGFLIIRAVFRAMSRPRMMPPGYGGPGMPGMPGYGGPGYGGGMGYGGGGGGSFFSGLLGGLGGAFLGNEMFGRNNGGNFGDASGAGIVGGDAGNQDASGFQSDAGQADMSNSSFGDYGSAGGGFDGGGGGFDSGGGGGGDSGGGW